MATYLITRHPATVDWIKKQGIPIDHQLEHLTEDKIKQLKKGDKVIGNLPIHLAAQVNQQGAHYLHLSLNIPFEYRGKELTEADLDEFGAHLTAYLIKKI